MRQVNKVKVALGIVLITSTFVNAQVKAAQNRPLVTCVDSSWSLIIETSGPLGLVGSRQIKRQA